MMHGEGLVMPPELLVLVSERDVSDSEQPGPGHGSVLRLVHLVEALVAAVRADRDDHAAPGGELGHQVRGQLRRGGPDVDGVVGP